MRPGTSFLMGTVSRHFFFNPALQCRASRHVFWLNRKVVQPKQNVQALLFSTFATVCYCVFFNCTSRRNHELDQRVRVKQKHEGNLLRRACIAGDAVLFRTGIKAFLFFLPSFHPSIHPSFLPSFLIYVRGISE